MPLSRKFVIGEEKLEILRFSPTHTSPYRKELFFFAILIRNKHLHGILFEVHKSEKRKLFAKN